jgi:hypothetical protein
VVWKKQYRQREKNMVKLIKAKFNDLEQSKFYLCFYEDIFTDPDFLTLLKIPSHLNDDQNLIFRPSFF